MKPAKYTSAFAATTVALLGGIWLAVSPWVLGFPSGSHGGWSASTRIDLWSGLGVVALAGVTLTAYGLTAAAELRAWRAAAEDRAAARAAAQRLAELRGPGLPPAAGVPSVHATPLAGPVSAAGGAPGVPTAARAVVTRSRLAPYRGPYVAPTPQPAGGGPSGSGGATQGEGATPPDVHALLAPIAAALVADLAKRRQDAASAGDEGEGEPPRTEPAQPEPGGDR